MRHPFLRSKGTCQERSSATLRRRAAPLPPSAHVHPRLLLPARPSPVSSPSWETFPGFRVHAARELPVSPRGWGRGPRGPCAARGSCGGGGGRSPADTGGTPRRLRRLRSWKDGGRGRLLLRDQGPARQQGLSGSQGPQVSSPSVKLAAPSRGRRWGVRVRDVCAGPTGGGWGWEGVSARARRACALGVLTCTRASYVRRAY